MKVILRGCLLGVLLAFVHPVSGWAGYWSQQPNDDILPTAPEAARAIHFDGRGFVINGQRMFILSGSVHYARVPREDWRDILLKLKRCGFNTVETYVFWNYHEAAEGKWDFTSESRDLGAFLDTAKAVGLWAIVRVGPYNCAEWDNGGFPIWLNFKPGLEVRKFNRPYLKCVDAWFDRMLPIVAKRQVHKGGNVILVQLENEQGDDHWRHWGLDMDGAYFRHLLSSARRNGLQVPMYFSGLHHGHDTAPEVPIDPSLRKSPWLSIELWTTWFDRYGNGKDLKNAQRHPWRVLSQGGNGFNLYMAHGGTNFDYFNNNETASSYDYGALIGQGGDTRELYSRLKRLAYFACSFSPILAHSDDATDHFADFAQGVSITARTAPEGTLVFLDNTSNKVATATLKDGAKIKLAAGEVTALAVRVPVASGVTLVQADARILGMVPQGDTLTMVCFGESGEEGRAEFGSMKAVRATTSAGFKVVSIPAPKNGWGTSLSFTFPSKGVVEETLDFGSSKVRVLVMNRENADRTWFVDTSLGRQIVVGAPYLGEFAWNISGLPELTVDYPWNARCPDELNVYGAEGKRRIPLSNLGKTRTSGSLALKAWETAVDFPGGTADAASWFSQPDGAPPAMGRDGDVSAYAWYLTHVSLSAPVSTLKFKRIGDRATIYRDGKRIFTVDTKAKTKSTEVPVVLGAGDHELAFFVAHTGRDKFVGYTGPLDTLDTRKGLCGPVRVGDGSVTLDHWKMRGGVDPSDPGLKWSASVAGGDKPAFHRTTFELDRKMEPGAVYRFITKGLSAGSVWLNGHNLGRYPEILKGCPGIWLPACWMKVGKNDLIIFDEQGCSPRETKVRLEKGASRHRIAMGIGSGDVLASATPLRPWAPVLPESHVERQPVRMDPYRKEADAAKAEPFLPGKYGTSAHQGKFIYIHLKNWREDKLILPGIPARVVYVSVLKDGRAGFLQSEHKIVVFLSLDHQGSEVVLAMRMDRSVDDLAPVAATGREMAVPNPKGTVYEAEDATLSGGTGVASDHDGFHGKGFVAGYFEGFGQTTTFTVKASDEGLVPARLRFSNGMGSEQTLSLVVNGRFVRRVKFKAGGDWDTWDDLDFELPMREGNNVVAFQKRHGDGCVNLDLLAVQD